jgi:hypothetical protein
VLAKILLSEVLTVGLIQPGVFTFGDQMRIVRAAVAAVCALGLAWLWSSSTMAEHERWALLLPALSVACIALLWE